jgi:hypothetical protein
MDGASTEMMIVMQEGSTSEEVDRILERLESASQRACVHERRGDCDRGDGGAE